MDSLYKSPSDEVDEFDLDFTVGSVEISDQPGFQVYASGSCTCSHGATCTCYSRCSCQTCNSCTCASCDTCVCPSEDDDDW